MTMAADDRKFFTDLVTGFKKEIIDQIEKKFTDQEKLFDAKLDPIGKLQDRLRDDIDDLYDKNRSTITELSELRTDFHNHTKEHDKTGNNTKWIIGIIITLIFALTGTITGFLALGV